MADRDTHNRKEFEKLETKIEKITLQNDEKFRLNKARNEKLVYMLENKMATGLEKKL